MSVVYNHIYLITADFTGLRSGLRQFNLSEDNMACGSKYFIWPGQYKEAISHYVRSLRYSPG